MSGLNHRIACSDEKRTKMMATRAETKLRRAGQVCKVCECKIVWNKLNKQQREALTMLFVEGKWFYNHVLSFRNEKHVLLKEINTTDIRYLKHLDKDGKEIISEIKYLTAQQKQGILQRMFSNELAIASLIAKGFQKHGSLSFKSELNCIPLKQYGASHKIKTKTKIHVSGIKGNIKVRGLDQIADNAEFANANLVKKPDGYYFMLTTYVDKDKISTPKTTDKEIGLDFGIKTNVTTSEGDKFDLTVRESGRLKRLQHQVQRRQRQSKRRGRSVRELRKEYQKQTSRKRDKANKILSFLKQYKCVVFQDEQIQNWHKGRFGKQVQHSCMGMLKSKLKQLEQSVVLDRYIATTKFCPKCFKKKQDITLADRIYKCSCGYEMDRDIHAAKNMLVIKDMVFGNLNVKLPTEHRKVTLAEFRNVLGVVAKHQQQKDAGRGSEKPPSL